MMETVVVVPVQVAVHIDMIIASVVTEIATFVVNSPAVYCPFLDGLLQIG